MAIQVPPSICNDTEEEAADTTFLRRWRPSKAERATGADADAAPSCLQVISAKKP